MYFKLSILAAFVAPLASALTVSQPTQAVFNGGQMTITWTIANGDPSTFSVYLQNPSFNSIYGVANNVNASLGTLTIEVPAVPDNQQYTVIFVPINNSTDVLAQSPPFTIGTAQSTTASTTAASSAATTSGATAANTVATTRALTTPSSAFGTTVSNTAPATATRSGSVSSSAPSSSSSPNAALPVRFNMNMGVVTSMVLSVFAGAAVVAL